MMKKSVLLSLCMIVRNEEDNLPRCLKSVMPVIDQLVIVDTGSTDKTVEIAREYGAEVYHFPWNNDFSAARNESLRHAKGRWILTLDADDELSPAARDRLRPLLAETPADALGMIIRNLSPDDDLVKYVDDVRFRLFRNGKGFSYEQKVHNQIAPSIYRRGGVTLDTDLIIYHHGYHENFQQKARRSLPLIEEALQQDPDNVYLQFKLAETLKALGKNAESIQAFQKMFAMDYKFLPSDIIATAYMRLAQLELAFDNYEQCLEYAAQSRRLQPNNPITKYLAGIANVYLENFEEGLALFKDIQANYSDDYFKKTDLTTLMQICKQVLQTPQA